MFAALPSFYLTTLRGFPALLADVCSGMHAGYRSVKGDRDRVERGEREGSEQHELVDSSWINFLVPRSLIFQITPESV
jgi:hypothetical protein